MGKENKNVKKLKKDFTLGELESLYRMLCGPYDVVFIKSPEEFSRLCDDFDERYRITGMKRMNYIYDSLIDSGDDVDYDGLLGSLRKFDELHGWNNGLGHPVFKYRLVLSEKYISAIKDIEGVDKSLCEWLESSLRYVGKDLSDGSKIYGFILNDDNSVYCMAWFGEPDMFYILDIDTDEVQNLLYNECGVKKLELE